jgi:hypothetical protein
MPRIRHLPARMRVSPKRQADAPPGRIVKAWVQTRHPRVHPPATPNRAQAHRDDAWADASAQEHRLVVELRIQRAHLALRVNHAGVRRLADPEWTEKGFRKSRGLVDGLHWVLGLVSEYRWFGLHYGNSWLLVIGAGVMMVWRTEPAKPAPPGTEERHV